MTLYDNLAIIGFGFLVLDYSIFSPYNFLVGITRRIKMLLGELFKKRQPRKFGFTPYYFKKEETEVDNGPRIKFRRVRRGITVSKKSVRSMVILAIFLIALFIYLLNLVDRDNRKFELEDIKIEVAPSGY